MQTRLAIPPGLWRLLVAAIVALALIVTLGPMSASATKSSSCSVTNTDSGQTFTVLQQAVDAATSGDRLVIRGTCHGPTVIDKDLALTGTWTERRGRPVLRGVRGSARTVTVTVAKGTRVSMRTLVISGPVALGRPRGIINHGTLSLRDVVLRNFSAFMSLRPVGSAIDNRGVLRTMGATLIRLNGELGSALLNSGQATLGGTTRVTQNSGCVRNLGVLVMNDSSSIAGCWAPKGSGVGAENEGSLVMNDSSSIWGTGGVWNRGELTMNDESSIHNNLSYSYMGPGAGGGVWNEGTLTMHDASSIHHNSVNGPSIYRATTPARGGGVYNAGTLVMTGDSHIDDNESKTGGNGVMGLGGGLYNASGGILVGVMCGPQTYANVYGNTPDDCYIE
jgi:hypothetical protein